MKKANPPKYEISAENLEASQHIEVIIRVASLKGFLNEDYLDKIPLLLEKADSNKNLQDANIYRSWIQEISELSLSKDVPDLKEELMMLFASVELVQPEQKKFKSMSEPRLPQSPSHLKDPCLLLHTSQSEPRLIGRQDNDLSRRCAREIKEPELVISLTDEQSSSSSSSFASLSIFCSSSSEEIKSDDSQITKDESRSEEDGAIDFNL